MTLAVHHFVWLANHPKRTEEWLRERLRDGFHIHHLDGNHYNNDPRNLILIEGLDHRRLHKIEGYSKMRRRNRLIDTEQLTRSEAIRMRIEAVQKKRAQMILG